MKVTVVVFALDNISTGTHSSVLSLERAATANNLQITHLLGGGPLIEVERSKQATVFIDNPDVCGDVLMMIDSDITFRPEACARVMRECIENKTIVSGLYVKKSIPTTIVAMPYEESMELSINTGIVDMKVAAHWFSCNSA